MNFLKNHDHQIAPHQMTKTKSVESHKKPSCQMKIEKSDKTYTQPTLIPPVPPVINSSVTELNTIHNTEFMSDTTEKTSWKFVLNT